MNSKNEEIVFFIDECLGGKLLSEIFIEAGEKVELHRDHFEQGTKDEVWLSLVAANNWVILTADQHIRTNNLERQAVEESGARLFVLVSGNLTGEQQARIFENALSRIKHCIHNTAKPFIATVYKNGKVTLLMGNSKKRQRRAQKRNEEEEKE
jgi:predicted nuclease of predicted toxin-antitoxin system